MDGKCPFIQLKKPVCARVKYSPCPQDMITWPIMSVLFRSNYLSQTYLDWREAKVKHRHWLIINRLETHTHLSVCVLLHMHLCKLRHRDAKMNWGRLCHQWANEKEELMGCYCAQGYVPVNTGFYLLLTLQCCPVAKPNTWSTWDRILLPIKFFKTFLNLLNISILLLIKSLLYS